MTQLLTVQMNIPNVPKVQNEQSSNSSTDKIAHESENSFNSILKKASSEESNEQTSADPSTQTPPTDDKISAPSSPDDGEAADPSVLASKEQERREAILELLAQYKASMSQDNTAPKEPDSSGVTGLNENAFLEFINKYLSGDNGSATQLKQDPLTSATDNSNLDASKENITARMNNWLQSTQSQQSGSNPLGSEASPVALTTQQQNFLDKLQQLLTSGKEVGTLSVKKVETVESTFTLRNNLTLLQSSSDNNTGITSPLVKDNGFTALEKGVFEPTLRTRQQQLSGVRHNSTQQFYDTKNQISSQTNDDANLSDKQQGNEMSQSGSGFNRMSSNTSLSETGATFNIPGNSAVDPLTGQITDPTKTTMLPSGTIIQDQEVLQQLIERFQINKKRLQSKIQLKLHPAELGKMEINLTVKEGSIRANVVAQSQHVQEILEKNLLKLKSVLERQGFKVEEISITCESGMVGEFDLFDQQLNNSDSSNFLNQDKKSEPQTPFVLEEFQDSHATPSSGLSVRA